MTTTVTGIESEAEVAQFAERLLGLYTGALLSAMIDVGHRTGLFEAAALGEVTSEELADRAGLQERYVREWLGSMVTSGIIDYHPAGRTYRLPANTRTPARSVAVAGSEPAGSASCVALVAAPRCSRINSHSSRTAPCPPARDNTRRAALRTAGWASATATGQATSAIGPRSLRSLPR